MLADQDLPELDPSRAGAGPAPPERAVVVVRERPRSRLAALIPPALILAAAFAILALRVRTPDWRGLALGPRDDPAPPAGGAGDAASGDPAGPAPARPAGPADPEALPPQTAITPSLPVPVDDDPTAVEADATPPEEAPARPPGDIPDALTAELYRPLSGEPAPPGPPQAPPDPVARAGDEVDPRRVWDEIVREATATAEERDRLEDLKPVLHERDDREAEARDAARRRDAADERANFHRLLREVLEDRAPNADDSLRRLAQLPARLEPPRDQGTVEWAYRLATSPSERQAWIATARAAGRPETDILYQLVFAHLANKTARGGPRTEADALRLAARELLATAPPPSDPRAQARPPRGLPQPADSSASPNSRFGVSKRR